MEESSSDSDSDSDDEEEAKPAAAKESSSSSSSDSSSDAEEPKETEVAPVVEQKKTNTPFQRVKADEKYTLPMAMRDNSFNADVQGRGTTWGQKAHNDLIVTRGKGFRHEKTKKKRGTYRGGTLSMEVRSIKFE